jgi:hypothetical protein
VLLARFVQRKEFVLRKTKNSVHLECDAAQKLQTLAEAVQDLFRVSREENLNFLPVKKIDYGKEGIGFRMFSSGHGSNEAQAYASRSLVCCG